MISQSLSLKGCKEKLREEDHDKSSLNSYWTAGVQVKERFPNTFSQVSSSQFFMLSCWRVVTSPSTACLKVQYPEMVFCSLELTRMMIKKKKYYKWFQPFFKALAFFIADTNPFLLQVVSNGLPWIIIIIDSIVACNNIKKWWGTCKNKL